MKSLKKYIAQHNKRMAQFKSLGWGNCGEDYPANPADLTQEQLRMIADRIGCEMQPESLYNDGERSHSAAMKIKAQLELVIADLKTLGIEVDLY